MWACQNQIASGIMQVVLHHYIVWPSTPILAFRRREKIIIKKKKKERKKRKGSLFYWAFKFKKTPKSDPLEIRKGMAGRVVCSLRLNAVQIVQWAFNLYIYIYTYMHRYIQLKNKKQTKELSQCWSPFSGTSYAAQSGCTRCSIPSENPASNISA